MFPRRARGQTGGRSLEDMSSLPVVLSNRILGPFCTGIRLASLALSQFPEGGVEATPLTLQKEGHSRP